MNDLHVTLLQTSISWHNASANLAHYTKLIDQLTSATDLIILPEMFTSGFTMSPAEVAEPMNGPSMRWLQAQAARTGAVITGTMVIEENGAFYNRLIWMQPDGHFHTYDKRHLFTMAGEHEHYLAGKDRLVVTLKGWRICPLICYDLRFPVWARNNDEYDLLIYTANWPNKRSYDWLTLLRARALENQCYVVGVNRVGSDPNGHEYNGDSCVIDPGWRHTLYHVEKTEAAHRETLSAAHLQQVRKQLPFLEDQDSFRIV